MNKLHLGNNLEYMRTLPSGSVDCIYSDILFATGRNFIEYQDLKANRKDIEDHYLPRLKEMWRLLKDTGCIYLQMDTRINHWVRIIMDDIFGYANFRNEISWCYNSQGKTTKHWCRKHDIILFYTKTSNFKFYPSRVMDSITDMTYRRFKKEIDKKGYYTSFKHGKEYKYYLENGSLPKDWFDDITYLSAGNKELTGYPTQKPTSLIKRLIIASTDEGDTVADFYLGSGSTAVSCIETNRNYIGCDINPSAIDIAIKRTEAAKKEIDSKLFAA